MDHDGHDDQRDVGAKLGPLVPTEGIAQAQHLRPELGEQQLVQLRRIGVIGKKPGIPGHRRTKAPVAAAWSRWI